jgi:hypothetical protein
LTVLEAHQLSPADVAAAEQLRRMGMRLAIGAPAEATAEKPKPKR